MFIQCISANNSDIFAWHVLMFNLKWNDCNCEDTICCVCAQIYLREQPFPEPFPWAALLLPLRWGADGSVGQSEGIWRRWVRSLTPPDISSAVRGRSAHSFLFFSCSQGLLWSLIKTSTSSQVGNPGYNGWGAYALDKNIRNTKYPKKPFKIPMWRREAK